MSEHKQVTVWYHSVLSLMIHFRHSLVIVKVHIIYTTAAVTAYRTFHVKTTAIKQMPKFGGGEGGERVMSHT